MVNTPQLIWFTRHLFPSQYLAKSMTDSIEDWLLCAWTAKELVQECYIELPKPSTNQSINRSHNQVTIHDDKSGKLTCSSISMACYLNARYDGKLLPDDVEQYQQFRLLVARYEQQTNNQTTNQASHDFVQSINQCLQDDRPWLLGNQITLIDILYASWFGTQIVRSTDSFTNESINATYPHVGSWLERCTTRSSFVQCQKTIDFLVNQSGGVSNESNNQSTKRSSNSSPGNVKRIKLDDPNNEPLDQTNTSSGDQPINESNNHDDNQLTDILTPHTLYLICAFLSVKEVIANLSTIRPLSHMFTRSCFTQSTNLPATHSSDVEGDGTVDARRKLELAPGKLRLASGHLKHLANRSASLPSYLDGGNLAIVLDEFLMNVPDAPVQAISRFGDVASLDLTAQRAHDDRYPSQVSKWIRSILWLPCLHMIHKLCIHNLTGLLSRPGQPRSHSHIDFSRLFFPKLRVFEWVKVNAASYGAERFLFMHSALTGLHLSSDFVSIPHLSSLLHSNALPFLQWFGYHSPLSGQHRELIESLCVRRETGSQLSTQSVDHAIVQPAVHLSTQLAILESVEPGLHTLMLVSKEGCTADVLRATFGVPGLRHLHVCPRSFDWLTVFDLSEHSYWSKLHEFVQPPLFNNQNRNSAAPHLGTTIAAQSQWQAFWSTLSRSPVLHTVKVVMAYPLTLDSTIMQILSSMTQLLSFTIHSICDPVYQRSGAVEWTHDWRDASMVQSVPLPCTLTHLHLSIPVLFSRASFVQFLCAVPKLQSLDLYDFDMGESLAIACVLVGVCPEIRRIELFIQQGYWRKPSRAEYECSHPWGTVTGEALIQAASEANVTAKSFVHVHHVHVQMCYDCHDDSMWHCFFSFFQHSQLLDIIKNFVVTTPLRLLALRQLNSVYGIENLCVHKSKFQSTPTLNKFIGEVRVPARARPLRYISFPDRSPGMWRDPGDRRIVMRSLEVWDDHIVRFRPRGKRRLFNDLEAELTLMERNQMQSWTDEEYKIA